MLSSLSEKMRIVSFDHAEIKAWDALCDASNQAWLFHCADWVKIEAKYFFPENHSFAVYDGQSIVAVQPLYQARIGLGSWNEVLLHSGVHRHTGLALVDGLDANSIKTIQSLAMRHIDDIAISINADRIHLNSQNLAPYNLSPHRSEIPFWVMNHGYFLGLGIGPNGMVPAPGLATCCADQIISLSTCEATLFSQLEQACRRAVRKAQSAGIELIATDEKSVASYYELAEISASRTGESLSPLLYYEDIWSALSDKGHCKIIYALSEGRKVAALWLLIYKGAAHFMGGVSDPTYLPMRVNDYLHWSSIVWAKHQGLMYYRLGPIFPELPDDWPVARVSKFKGKFGGEAYSTIQGSYFRHPEKYLETAKAQISTLLDGVAKSR